MIGRLVARRSSRDWPGLRGMPAVTMRTSAPSRSAQFDVPRDVRVVAEDGAVLLEIERLALGEVLLRGDVEEDDVAELLVRAEARELAADVACADEGDLLAGRRWKAPSFWGSDAFRTNVRPLTRARRRFRGDARQPPLDEVGAGRPPNPNRRRSRAWAWACCRRSSSPSPRRRECCSRYRPAGGRGLDRDPSPRGRPVAVLVRCRRDVDPGSQSTVST